MAKRCKLPPTDGLGPREKKRIRAAVRQVWHWSHAKKLVIKRCTDKDGFGRCENPDCSNKLRRHPKIYVDHIRRVGAVDGGFLDRMFIPSKLLQGLCKKCHDAKTREENALQKEVEYWELEG